MFRKNRRITMLITWLCIVLGLFGAKRIVDNAHESKGIEKENESTYVAEDEEASQVEYANYDEEPYADDYEDPADRDNEADNEMDSYPVLLSEMTPFQGQLEIKSSYDYSYADNLGNSGYAARLWKSDHNETSNYVTYILNREYKTISFDVALPEDYKDAESPVWIEVWGDGRKIGETTQFKSGVRPESYQFDISDVDELTIKVEAAMYFSLIDGGNVSNKILIGDVYIEK